MKLSIVASVLFSLSLISPMFAVANTVGAGDIGSAFTTAGSATCRGNIFNDRISDDRGTVAVTLKDGTLNITAETSLTLSGFQKDLEVVGGKKGWLDSFNRIRNANVYAGTGEVEVSLIGIGYSSAPSEQNLGGNLVLTINGTRYYSVITCDFIR